MLALLLFLLSTKLTVMAIVWLTGQSYIGLEGLLYGFISFGMGIVFLLPAYVASYAIIRRLTDFSKIDRKNLLLLFILTIPISLALACWLFLLI